MENSKHSGELSLQVLFRTLTAKVHSELFVFVTIPEGQRLPPVAPQMMFKEAEGTTLIVSKTEAQAQALDHAFPCRMITLEVHSALEAVGFIAHIATELAREGMGVNPVAGFFHDHLFVPDGREHDALRVLNTIKVSAS